MTEGQYIHPLLYGVLMRGDTYTPGGESVGLRRVSELPPLRNNVARGSPPSESKAFTTDGKEQMHSFFCRYTLIIVKSKYFCGSYYARDSLLSSFHSHNPLWKVFFFLSLVDLQYYISVRCTTQ